jgi:antitoxin ParD1/3/4
MHVQKLSVSLPNNLIQFVEEYQKRHGCESRSQVLHAALTLLKQRELERAYEDAYAEMVEEAAIWDAVSADGLDDETW